MAIKSSVVKHFITNNILRASMLVAFYKKKGIYNLDIKTVITFFCSHIRHVKLQTDC